MTVLSIIDSNNLLIMTRRAHARTHLNTLHRACVSAALI